MDVNSLSRIVIGKAIDIHKQLGPGLLENPYRECLFSELRDSGIFVEKEKPIKLHYKSVEIDCAYRLDLLVEGKLVIEVKSIESLNNIHTAQTLTYLRVGKYPLGLLINFNVHRLKDGIKRIINFEVITDDSSNFISNGNIN